MLQNPVAVSGAVTQAVRGQGLPGVLTVGQSGQVLKEVSLLPVESTFPEASPHGSAGARRGKTKLQGVHLSLRWGTWRQWQGHQLLAKPPLAKHSPHTGEAKPRGS